MTKQRNIRRLAMQALYQFDVRGDNDRDVIRETLAADARDEEAATKAFELALAVWAIHAEADALVTTISPDWPTHRQPPVDRALIRLAYYEMVTDRAHPSVVITEAIALAKRFCAEQSPSFINGVLDKVARRIKGGETSTDVDLPGPPSDPNAENPGPKVKVSADAWLADAIRESGKPESDNDDG